MKKLKVYDPAMCCETGVCGVDADTKLINLSSDIDWLRKQGASVQRFNLAHEPSAFVSDPLVKAELDEHGESCLPLFVLDDQVISRGVYPDRQQLQLWTDIELSTEQSTQPQNSADCGCSSNKC
jgi:hypothetical protein